jgi:hypothetical protein
MSSLVLTQDHAKSKSGDVTKVARKLQGFCDLVGRFPATHIPTGILAGKKKRGIKPRFKNLLGGGGGALTGQIGGQANQRVSIF